MKATASRALLGAAIVAAACGLLRLAGAELEFAAVALLLAVVGASLLGYAAGFAAAATGFVLLLYAFTPPIGRVVVRDLNDFFVGVAFFVGALVTGFLVARLNELRRRSERSAREAELRVALSEQLLGGAGAGELMQRVADEATSVFALRACTLSFGELVVRAHEVAPHGRARVAAPVERRFGDLTMTIEPSRTLAHEERAALDAIGASLAIALDRIRLEAAAHEIQLHADLARSRAGFLTAVTHDLRTPLATIKGATAALLVRNSPLGDADRRELLEIARDESEDLERLLNKVLELTRIRAGASAPRRVAVAPADLLASAAKHVRQRQPGCCIDVCVPDELPGVAVDVVMLEHVLVNLVENAAEHTPPGGVVRLEASHGERVLAFRVIDHGPGIAPEDREIVFDEFVRLDAQDRRGMGLGLAIVRVLVDAHEGKVSCEETPGGGATFVVELPMADFPDLAE